MLQGLGHGLEGGAVAQGPGLAFEQADVMAPVVQGLPTLKTAWQAHWRLGRIGAGADHHQAVRIGAQAHRCVRPLARHAVAVALIVDQRGGRYPCHLLDIAIEWRRVGHQVRLLLLPDVGNGQLGPLGVRQFMPGVQAGLVQPRIEALQVRPAAFGRLQPDATTAILHVLLDNALLPASGAVAELRLEQVVARHGLEAGVDRAALALANLVDSCLHVVVDAPPWHAAKGSRGAGMGVKQHLMGLAEVGGEHEGAAGRQLGVRGLQALAHAAHEQVLAAPVELEGLAHLEAHGHEGHARGRIGLRLLPALGELIDRASAARIAHGPQCPEHGLDATALALVAVAVGLQPGGQLFLVRI